MSSNNLGLRTFVRSFTSRSLNPRLNTCFAKLISLLITCFSDIESKPPSIWPLSTISLYNSTIASCLLMISVDRRTYWLNDTCICTILSESFLLLESRYAICDFSSRISFSLSESLLLLTSLVNLTSAEKIEIIR